MADATVNMMTRVGIVGEKEYREACKGINKNIALLNSEMKLATAEFKENANSMEALKAKHDILQKTYDEQAKKVELAKSVLEEYENAENKNISAIQKAQKELNYQKAALENTNNALKENVKQQQEAERATSTGAQAQKEYEQACKGIDRNLSLLSAELQEVNAKYKGNESSAKAVAEKQEVLKKAYAEQAKKLEETKKAYESMKKEYGENSQEAKELETQLHKERAALYDVDNQVKETEVSHSKFAGVMGNIGSVLAKGLVAVGAATAAIGSAVAAGLGYAVSQADEAKGALNDFCASTGTARDEADQYKQVMENIYNANYGEGFEDIAASMATVRQQAGDLGADELERMTTNAIVLRDTFEMDVAESTRTVTQLMQKFGISGEEAYNLIAQGAQQGLNQNGDLLDVINEYSNQYAQAGLSAEDMFNSIKNGADTGVWSIDKMGDAFKEFSIRMNDGTAGEYLTNLGLNADELVGKFQAGGDSAKEAMSQISEALRNCDDETLQYTSGVGIMGTMWEDMGTDACTALMSVEGEISKAVDTMGKINEVKYDTFGEAIQGAGRILQTSFIMPIGERALPIFSRFANEIQQGAASAGGDMGKMAQSFGDAVSEMVSGLSEILPEITNFAVEVVTGLANGIVQSAPTIVKAGTDMITALVDGIMEAIPELTESAAEIINTLMDGVVQLIPSIAEGAVQIMAGLADGLGQAAPVLIPSIVDAMLTIVETLANNVPLLIDAALQLISGLADGLIAALPVLIERLPEVITSIINGLVEGLPQIMERAGDIITSLVDGIIAAIPLLIEAMPQIILAIATGLIEGLPQILIAAGKLVQTIVTELLTLPGRIKDAIWGGIEKIVEWGAAMKENGGQEMAKFVADVIEKVKELPLKIYNSIIGAIARVSEWGANMKAKAREKMNDMVIGIVTVVKEIPIKIYNSISGAIAKVAAWGVEVKNQAVEGMRNVVRGITGVFSGIGSTFASIGRNMVEGIYSGISNATQWIKDQIRSWVGNVTDFLKNLFGIKSPSTLMRDEVGVYLAQGIGVGFVEEMRTVNRMIEDSIPKEFDVGTKVTVGKDKDKEPDFDENPEKPKPRPKGGAAGGLTIVQNIYANTTDYAKQQKEAARQFKQAARMVLA